MGKHMVGGAGTTGPLQDHWRQACLSIKFPALSNTFDKTAPTIVILLSHQQEIANSRKESEEKRFRVYDSS